MAFLIRKFFVCALFLLTVANPQSLYAADNLELAEQEIKAGLLYNFLKYTQWPAASMEKSSSMIVCIFGDDPFGGYLKPMSGRTVNQREITLREVSDIKDTQNCHLLFINADKKELWPELNAFLAGKGILTVSDFSGFVASGGIIQFGRKDNRIHVELNMDAATKAGLTIHERLLKLVTVVRAPSAGNS
jgi:hypothetical protein